MPFALQIQIAATYKYCPRTQHKQLKYLEAVAAALAQAGRGYHVVHKDDIRSHMELKAAQETL